MVFSEINESIMTRSFLSSVPLANLKRIVLLNFAFVRIKQRHPFNMGISEIQPDPANVLVHHSLVILMDANVRGSKKVASSKFRILS